jgi:hypothetical protein
LKKKKKKNEFAEGRKDKNGYKINGWSVLVFFWGSQFYPHRGVDLCQ